VILSGFRRRGYDRPVRTTAVFPGARLRAGMYESFYLRAVAPDRRLGIWIRHTVHKPPGRPPRGSVWCTVFDAGSGGPYMHKLTSERVAAPAGAWITIGEDASMAPGVAEGRCGEARWKLRFSGEEPELRHLAPEWLYRAPLPRTKLTSPHPAARFDGVLELSGRGRIELHGWRGMVGHNWGAEHAERWIWLHGISFKEDPTAWLDVALGRLMVAGRLTPWVANGAISIGGRRHRLGGLGARGLSVAESPQGCDLHLVGPHGLVVSGRVDVPPGTAAGWRYADPDGGEHDVVNCSIAALALNVRGDATGTPMRLHSDHGAAYELGMRERDHGVAIAPFGDG
jgi:hypothetical protein